MPQSGFTRADNTVLTLSSCTSIRCGFCRSITDFKLHFDTSSATRCIAVFTMSLTCILLPNEVNTTLFALKSRRLYALALSQPSKPCIAFLSVDKPFTSFWQNKKVSRYFRQGAMPLGRISTHLFLILNQKWGTRRNAADSTHIFNFTFIIPTS